MTNTKRASAAIAALAAMTALVACSSTPEPQGAETSTEYSPSIRVIDVGGKNATISAAAGDMLVLDPVTANFDKHDWKVTVTPPRGAAVGNSSVPARVKGQPAPSAPVVAFTGTETVTITVKQKSTGFSQKITVKVAKPQTNSADGPGTNADGSAKPSK